MMLRRFLRSLGRLAAIAAVAAALAQPAAATPPPPMPPPPPENPALLAAPAPALTSTGDPRVDAYRQRLITDRLDPRWGPYFRRLLAGIEADPEILRQFDELAAIHQPADYIAHYVTPDRIRRGRALYLRLKRTAAPDSMPLELRLALWGMLSDYGRTPPKYDALQVLLVLGAHGRGAATQNFQLHHAAGLILSGKVPRARLRAYPTGRLGQPQLLADRFEEQARDGNGDGRIDIWASRGDVLPSIRAGDWSQYPGMPVLVAVKPASFDRTDRMQARMARSLEQPYNVPAQILRRWDGRAWTRAQRAWSGTYVEPFGVDGPAFLLLLPATPVNMLNPARPRYFDDTKDLGFGLAAGLLAEAIAGRPLPPIRARH